ncbi:vesicle transport V-SNARE protein (macronuclear) [Tetrahymena thermophila SB210]|uniref:Vesicle transport V-SNARE protein n=1 Tax=Tetrahymena thermophila (strain SB210) TaxID=312017 RepID=I7MB58_TETTS|nr:vesicle transport V-SNARE protein [Tetrahymena thermophila SB210]EAS07701.2 vesicle transport V-SNARE protein [Tetrahymena thermophila SB210]|eukprot:XP_001027943.2 vesicle transport V-SNARE protein [Tetrahymena thermophila SB210]
MAQHVPLADDSYEQDYEKIKEQFNKKLQKFNTSPDQNILKELKRDVDDAQNTIRLIEQEINSLPSNQRNGQGNKVKKLNKNQLSQNNLKIKIRRYRDEVEKMKKQFRDVQQHSKDLSDLVGNSTDDSDRYNSQGNQVFQKLSQQNKKLMDAKRQVYDLEGQGNTILQSISDKNQQIDGIIRNNRDITQELSTANKLVDRIHRNIIQRKATLYAVIGFLLFCLIIIVMSWF